MGFGKGKGFSPVIPPAPTEERIYDGTWSNRDIRSTHGTWSLARSGINLFKNFNYLPAYHRIIVATYLTASYWIHRGWLFFDTSDLPSGAVIVGGKLRLFVTAHSAQIGGDLNITKGIQHDPVLLTDFAAQLAYDTVGGAKEFEDLVDGQYNEIDLNSAALPWINVSPAILQQFESYDSGENADFLCRDTFWWCQSFTPLVNHKKNSIKLKMFRVGSPGTITVSIKAADASHFPTGAALCSGTFDGNSLTTVSPGAWYEITLGDGASLDQGTEYAIEVKAPGGSVNNRVLMRGNSSGDYLGGQAAFSDNSGSTWTAYAAYDMYFDGYNTDLASPKGTQLCLRASSDVSDAPPVAVQEDSVHFYSGQKGDNYKPQLVIAYHL